MTNLIQNLRPTTRTDIESQRCYQAHPEIHKTITGYEREQYKMIRCIRGVNEAKGTTFTVLERWCEWGNVRDVQTVELWMDRDGAIKKVTRHQERILGPAVEAPKRSRRSKRKS